MSSGLYEAIGDEYFYVLPGQQSDYSGWYNATKYLLSDIADEEIDYSLYDNWTLGSNYNHSNVPDGKVDHVIVIWRGRLWGTWAGRATMGTHQFTSDEGITIQAYYGSTVHFDSWMNMSYVREVAVHEMGHKLIGPHPYGNNQHFSIWGLLSSIWHSGSAANSYERYILGWANAIDLTTDITLNIPDTYSNNVIYRFHPPNGSETEYYYFENHQKTNIFDDLTTNNNDKGIFVLHARDGYNWTNNIHVHTSEGFFDFENPAWVDDFWNQGELLPGYRIDLENRYNQSKKEQLTISNPPGSYVGDGTEWLHAYYHDATNIDYGGWFRGYNSNFGYSSSGNSLMTPWGNPAATVWNTTTSADIAFEVNSENGGISNVTFYVNDPRDSRPFKPINVSITEQNGHPKIQWDANLEPDHRRYRVWRMYPDGGPLPHTTNTYYIDGDVQVLPDDDEIAYYVVAEDWSALLSDASNVVTTWGMMFKTISGEASDLLIPAKYGLMNNYPNPFNPSTAIHYALPERSNVKIIIYNFEGREVVRLVDEVQHASIKNVVWNGVDSQNQPVASGVYFYKMDAKSLESDKIFNKNMKMTLLK